MPRLRWFLALLLIPFLDTVLLAVIVTQLDVIGWIGMVALVVLTGLIGMLLVRAEGRRTIRKMQRSLAQGNPPTNELLDGALLIAAGAFLLTPGLVTDLIGFLLVLPLTRIPIRAGLKRFIVVPYVDKKTDGLASGVVWTAGFPGGGESGVSWSGSGEGPGPRAGSDTGGDSRTVDLDDDSYTVGSGSEDTYRIDFGDDETRDDEPNAR